MNAHNNRPVYAAQLAAGPATPAARVDKEALKRPQAWREAHVQEARLGQPDGRHRRRSLLALGEAEEGALPPLPGCG